MALVSTPRQFLPKNKILKKANLPKYLLVLLVVLLAYGQTLLMYFWQDDSALIFKLMNPEGRAGSFGYGIIGSGAYKYLVTPFVPFFPIFGKEPFGYFLVGLITYCFAAIAFYFFAKTLFKKRKTAYLATLLFSSGYIGGDTMLRVINSWQTNIGLILALVTLGLYVKYQKSNSFRTYLFSVLFFWATVELVFIRSHSLVLAVVFMDFVFRLIPFKARRIPGLVLRSIPFLAIFYSYYMTDATFGAPGANSIVRKIILEKDIVALSPYLANLGNVFVPDVIQSKVISIVTKTLLSKESFDSQVLWLGILTLAVSVGLLVYVRERYKLRKRGLVLGVMGLIGAFYVNLFFFDANPLWYRDIQTIFSGGMSLMLLIVLLYLSVGLWKEDKIHSKTVLIGTFIASSQFFGYFVQYPTSVFSTHHRYFSHSIIGTSILFGTLSILWLKNHKDKLLLSFLPFLVVIGTYLSLGLTYQRKLVLDRSRPTRQFYCDLTKFVPIIKKGSAFYFDVASKGRARTQFRDFFSVGSMPESTALAIYYGVDRYEVYYFTDFDELLYKIDSGEVDIDSLYTFFVSGYNFREFSAPEGLINTTGEFREALSRKKVAKRIRGFPISFASKYKTVEGYVTSERVFIDIKSVDIPSVTHQLVEFTANLSFQHVPDEFPYQFGREAVKTTYKEKQRGFSYLDSRNEYYRDAKVESISEWKYRETRNLIDGDIQTPWQGHRIWWHDHEEDAVAIDLGKAKEISKLVWVNWKTVLAPVSYEIQTSLNGVDWETVKSVTKGPERRDGEVAIEEFSPVVARFVRMYIGETQTNDSPAITEIEVVEKRFSGVDVEAALNLFSNPFSYVRDKREWEMVTNAFLPLAVVEVSWKSDKSDYYSEPVFIPVLLDGKDHKYQFILPSGGTKVEHLRFNFSYPVKGEIKSASYRNLTLNQLRLRGLIQEFKEN